LNKQGGVEQTNLTAQGPDESTLFSLSKRRVRDNKQKGFAATQLNAKRMQNQPFGALNSMLTILTWSTTDGNARIAPGY